MQNFNETFHYLQEQVKSLRIFNVLNDDISYIKDIAKKFSECKKVLVIGTGGSSLGGKAITSFNAAFNGTQSKIIFLENTDSRHFLNIVRNCDPATTGVIVISKSGRTTEPLMLFLTLCEMWPEFDFQNRAIAITELSENNDLRILAESKGMEIVEHDPKIGGRFSVFSVVGLLPAIIDGVDVDLFLKGARAVANDIRDTKYIENSIIFPSVMEATQGILAEGITEHVVMPYSDLFEDFGKWYVQLCSESLGKTEEFGITPVRAVGTIDQHSMLQLFLGGPSNKYFTVIIQKNNNLCQKIDTDLNSNIISQLNNHSIDELMIAHQRATIDVLSEKASVRILEFNEFTIATLGFLMMLSFMEIITVAHVAGVNPFDQPAVEKSKKLALQYLSEM